MTLTLLLVKPETPLPGCKTFVFWGFLNTLLLSPSNSLWRGGQMGMSTPIALVTPAAGGTTGDLSPWRGRDSSSVSLGSDHGAFHGVASRRPGRPLQAQGCLQAGTVLPCVNPATAPPVHSNANPRAALRCFVGMIRVRRKEEDLGGPRSISRSAEDSLGGTFCWRTRSPVLPWSPSCSSRHGLGTC